jgi:DNA mismatch endonuclease (patch repair protein)
MADVHTPAQRSANMSAIRARDTKPEMIVRRLLHSLGFRYRLHAKKLPGKPDLVLARHRKVIFVHGCFWHVHDCKYGKVKPMTRPEFWAAKRAANVERDQRNLTALRTAGWNVLIIWECATENQDTLTQSLLAFLSLPLAES